MITYFHGNDNFFSFTVTSHSRFTTDEAIVCSGSVGLQELTNVTGRFGTYFTGDTNSAITNDFLHGISRVSL